MDANVADILGASEAIKQICRTMIREKKDKLAKGQSSGVDILSVAIESGGFSDEDLVNQMMTFLGEYPFHHIHIISTPPSLPPSSHIHSINHLTNHPTPHHSRGSRNHRQRPNLGPRIPLPTPHNSNPSQTRHQRLLPPLHPLPHLHPNRRRPRQHPLPTRRLRRSPALPAPVPFTMRSNPAPATILGQLIPANTTVVMSPLATNLNPELWGPDAAEFKPERWLDTDPVSGKQRLGSGGASSNYAFMTFLHGPRSCIGQGFSRAEFAALVAGWVGGFETRLADEGREIEVAGGITQRVKGGLRVVLTPVGEGSASVGAEGEKAEKE